MPSPIRVLELRTSDGPGGGPEKTILLGAAQADPDQLCVTVCYIRGASDTDSRIHERARSLGLDYAEIRERRRWHFSNFLQAQKLVRSRNIQIVHSHDYKSDLFAWGLSRSMGVIPFSTAHGWTGNSLREQWLYYPLDRRLLRRFSGVIAVSGQIQHELVNAGVIPRRIRTLLNGIDHHTHQRNPARSSESRSRLGLMPGDRVIGAVGRLEQQKRFDLLIHAFARLRHLDSSRRLVIAGEGSLRFDLQSLIGRLGLSDSCRLVGHQSDMIEFYHALDLLIQSSDYEGTSNVVLEAMALEVPIVATDVGGTSQMMVHETHGLLVPPGDIDSLITAIERTLKDQLFREKMVIAARRRVEQQLSFERRQFDLERFYRDVVQEAFLDHQGNCQPVVTDSI